MRVWKTRIIPWKSRVRTFVEQSPEDLYSECDDTECIEFRIDHHDTATVSMLKDDRLLREVVIPSDESFSWRLGGRSITGHHHFDLGSIVVVCEGGGCFSSDPVYVSYGNIFQINLKTRVRS